MQILHSCFVFLCTGTERLIQICINSSSRLDLWLYKKTLVNYNKYQLTVLVKYDFQHMGELI